MAEIVHDPGDWVVGGLNGQIPVVFDSLRHCYQTTCENAGSWYYDSPLYNNPTLSAPHGTYWPASNNSFLVADDRG